MKGGVIRGCSAALLLVPGLLMSANTRTDVLLLDSIDNAPANTQQGVPRPTRGMTMQSVRSRFGEPALAHPRVGDPPITRWDYQRYSVFFEHNHVLTAVMHR